MATKAFLKMTPEHQATVARTRALRREVSKRKREGKSREATLVRRKEREEKWELEMRDFCTSSLPSSWQRIDNVNVLPKRPVCRDATFTRWPGAYKSVERDPEDDEMSFWEERRAVDCNEEDQLIEQLDTHRRKFAAMQLKRKNHDVHKGKVAVLRPTPTELTASIWKDREWHHSSKSTPEIMKRPSIMTMIVAPKTSDAASTTTIADAPTAQNMRQPRPKLGRTGIKISDYIAGNCEGISAIRNLTR